MLRPRPPAPVHRAVATLLAASVLSLSLPVRAQETRAQAETGGSFPWVTVGLTGIAVGSAAWAGFSLLAANSYYDDRKELSRSLGGTGDLGRGDVACTTPDTCARKAELRDKQADARASFYTGAIISGSFAALALASGIYLLLEEPEKADKGKPKDKDKEKDKGGEQAATRIVPTASPSGGGLGIVGTF